MRGLLFIIVMLSIISANAQKITLSGKVTEQSSDKAMANVVVTVRPNGQNKIIKFATTKADGSYTLMLNAMPEGNHVLHFSMIGYAVKTIPLTSGQTIYNVAMEEKATELKGVKIKAPSIRQKGDTISYSVASFADANDKSLEDVLKKMPGVEVEESGKIKYNGKEINKFYIEGHDMLGGRYSLATNNIHQEDVGTVEVMTNHQPIKALEDMVFSENPAINIKLKETAKGRWAGTAKIGAGAEDKDIVWNGELALMRFAKKVQSLNTLKSNNTGTDITREITLKFDDFDGGSLGNTYSLQNYISATPDRLTEISDSRVRDNQTHTITTNDLWAISNRTDVTTQITYIKDKLTSSSISRTQYFLNDTTIIIDDYEKALQKRNEASINLTLTSNGDSAYITNKLSTELKWNDVTMDIVQNGQPLYQVAEVPKYQISDNFEILLRKGQKAYSFDTYNVYMRNPHTLSTSDAIQNVRSSAYFNHTHTSLGFYLNPFTVSMEVGIQILNRLMESDLTGAIDTSLHKNDIKMAFVRTYATPKAEYNNGGWHIKFKIPLTYTPYVFNDNLSREKDRAYKTQISPSLHVSYDLNNHLKCGLSARVAQRDINEKNFYHGIIMQDHRNINIGFVDYTEDKSKIASFNVDYKRPLLTIFMNGYISKSWTDMHLTAKRDFIGDYVVNSYYSDKSKSEFTMAGGAISKGLGFMRGLIRTSFDYIKSNGTMRQGETTSDYQSDNYTWGAKLNGRPLLWFNFTYEIKMNKSVMTMKEVAMETKTTDQSQHLTINFFPTERWQIKLIGDYFHNQVAEGQHKNLYLADASTSYNLKNGIEFTLTALNLFDQHTYGYTTEGSLTRMSKEYKLRARTIIGSMFFHF
ncbi:MAG: carboxypeptidase-like regulatory domain-containing protein [Bacteroidales bacterium]|nr:carboxypeptidase-like regulatory domain-containing protein [Bacteroidales bacterium]